VFIPRVHTARLMDFGLRGAYKAHSSGQTLEGRFWGGQSSLAAVGYV
jgi:hypothetical protein